MLREFPRSPPITPQVDCLFSQGSHENAAYFESFSHLAKGVVPAIKPHLPNFLGAFVKPFSYKLLQPDCLRDLRDPCYLCSCEFIRIHEKEPLVPPSSCSTVPAVLCGLVPVCASAIVRTTGWSSCSFGQPSPTYGLHPTLVGIKLVISAGCS